jgi:hypothetical protein
MFKKKSLTSTSLGLRIVMGGYLLYLAYSLIPSIRTAVDTKEFIFWIVMVTLFFGVGSVIVFFSLKALIKGEYDKGTDSESSDEQDVSNEIEANEIKEENRTDNKEN